MKKTIFWVSIFIVIISCSTSEHNELTTEERAQGWQLLFDGNTSNGWRRINSNAFPDTGWVIANGELCCHAQGMKESAYGGDIITIEQYSDFELKWEWKMITKGGNSGIKYLVQETIVTDNPMHGIGFEYQLLDDFNHAWMKEGKMQPGDYHTLAAVYELYPCPIKNTKPLGEWNNSRIKVHNNQVEHWLNGDKVVSFRLGSDDLNQCISKSKFKDIPGFGQWDKGHILIQDHGSEVCFRNIKIKVFNH